MRSQSSVVTRCAMGRQRAMALGVNADLTRLRTRWCGAGSCQIITLAMTSLNEPSPWLNASSTTCVSFTARWSRKMVSVSAKRENIHAPWKISGRFLYTGATRRSWW